ncbi:MAG: hypothetical protein M1825_000060 [Sarcosagium campestre]|nr:MAG: hypothetical protein M1825_000060 [Sarcosagium campestre]
MDPQQDFASLQEEISSVLVSTTKTAGHIASEDLAFHRSLEPSIGHAMDRHSSRLLDLAGSLLRIAARSSDIDPPTVKDAEDVEDHWRGIVDVVDSLLEKADTCLDEYTGVIKRPSVSQKESAPAPKANSRRLDSSLRHQNIRKPQLDFHDKPDNDDSSPFKPLLTSKPHAVVPFAQSIVLEEEPTEQRRHYIHPYGTEIAQHTYPDSVFRKADPIPFRPLDSTKAILVDDAASLASMLEVLRGAKEIAVDLEHHDTRSYVGLVCLMQISTRDQDFIVDTLKPWRRELQILNKVFADPNIVKVFHGAFMDVIWLQRDLGLYLVGLFDTFHAARALGYTQASLASLLSRFASFNADKKYQMADWRIRPLPTEMFDYARSDTHFLLYIYDRMRNELIDKGKPETASENPLDAVLWNSKETSLQRYERYVYDREGGTGSLGWQNMLSRNASLFSNEQLAVFKAVHEWRDRMARKQDDGLNYVMPKHALFSVAREMPADLPTLLSLCHPMSPEFRRSATHLLTVIKEARNEANRNAAQLPAVDPLLPQPTTTPQALATADAAAVVVGSDIDEKNQKQDELPAFRESSGTRGARSLISRFWGSTFGSSVWKGPKHGAAVEKQLHLAVPLPQLTAEIFVDPKAEADIERQTDPGARAEHEFTRKRKATSQGGPDVFTVKELGGGRKKRLRADEDDAGAEAATTEGEGEGEGDGMRDVEHEASYERTEEESQRVDHEAERAARKKARKEARRKRKLEASGSTDAAVGDGGVNGGDIDRDAEEPFDYTKAESVLHAAKKKPADDPRTTTAFNPYAKAADAPKGKRKAQRELPGRSFTFKGQ